MQTRRTILLTSLAAGAASTLASPALAHSDTPISEATLERLRLAVAAHPHPAGLLMARRSFNRIVKSRAAQPHLTMAKDPHGVLETLLRGLPMMAVDADDRNTPLLANGEVIVIGGYDLGRFRWVEVVEALRPSSAPGECSPKARSLRLHGECVSDVLHYLTVAGRSPTYL